MGILTGNTHTDKDLYSEVIEHIRLDHSNHRLHPLKKFAQERDIPWLLGDCCQEPGYQCD
jgi:hypothetical protein